MKFAFFHMYQLKTLKSFNPKDFYFPKKTEILNFSCHRIYFNYFVKKSLFYRIV